MQTPQGEMVEREDSRPVIPHCEIFFEGPEKLFEVTFKAPAPMDPMAKTGLRTVERAVWEEMLCLVHCEIVSVISDSFVDAYLLSESSLFVFPRRLMIKTCGTTTLLRAVPRILEIARLCGLEEIESLFFTRKNFLRPEMQIHPHTSFDAEVKALDQLFDNGTPYILGKLNGDHLNVYTVDHSPSERLAPDQNLEILMHELDPDCARMFYRKSGEEFLGSRPTTIEAGVQGLFPNAKLDDLVFDPCGYSVNGIFDGYYFTIHVTPQPEFSFASFETNAPLKSYDQLIKQVLEIFRPGRYSITVVANEDAKCGSSAASFDPSPPQGFLRDDMTHSHFSSFNLTYAHFHLRC